MPLLRPARRCVAALVLACTVPAGALRAQEPGEPSDDPLAAMGAALADAERSLALGERQIAESRFRSAVLEGWLALASMARQTGDLAAARAALESAARAVVDSRLARLRLAVVMAEMSEPDEAEVLLRGLIAEDTSDFEARRHLAQTLADAGRAEEAVQELEQLRYLAPGNAENAYLLATAYLRRGRIEDARALLGELAESIPTPETWVLIGRTYRDAELFDAAREALREALAMAPGIERAHYYLGTIFLLGEGATALGDAIREFELELEVRPDDAMSRLYLGMALAQSRRFEEAVPHLEIAARGKVGRVDALRFLGRSLLETGRTDEAVTTLRRGLEASAWRPDGSSEGLSEFEARQISSLHYQLAQALRRTDRREEAGVHFEEAKRFQGRIAESARESLGRFLADEAASSWSEAPGPAEPVRIDRERVAQAEALVEGSLARAYLNLGILKARSQAFDAAADLLAQAAELDPELPGLQYSLGVALFNAERFADAAPALERSLAERPADRNLEQMLAMAWLNSGAYERAARALEKLPERSSNPRLEYAYGLALVRGGRSEEAEAVFEGLLRQNSEWPELIVLLGQAYAQQGDFDSAADSLERAIALSPGVAEAHATLGEIHLRRGELDQAEESLRTELSHHPGDQRARFTLATVLDLNQKPDQAKAELQRLLAAQPDLGKARYLMGKVLLAEGAAEEAREQLEAAAGLSPDDANIRYQLGQAYQKLGRTEEARREFDTFRKLKSERTTGESP